MSIYFNVKNIEVDNLILNPSAKQISVIMLSILAE
jgi:hypothetical protein